MDAMNCLFAMWKSKFMLHQLDPPICFRPHMKKLYGHKVRGKSGIEMAISQIVNEAVEKNPNLKMVAKSASELNLKAREEAKRIKRQVSEKALNLKVQHLNRYHR